MDDVPATKQDVHALQGQIQALEERMTTRMDAFEGRMSAFDGRMDAFEGRMDALKEQIEESEARSREFARELQTEVLRAIFALVEANQRRFVAVEQGGARMVDRMAHLEARVLEIEKRLHLPPAA